MRNGFKFKGKHSSEFGVTVRTKSRPIRPAAKSFTMDLPYRDGVYDFSEANPQSREHYMNRVFVISVAVTADNLNELQKKIGALSQWLRGSGDLVFDDIPLIVWRGKISDEVIYMPEHGGKSAMLEVSFSVHPFGYNMFSTEGPVLDSPLRLDDLIPLSLIEKYTYTMKQSGEFNVINFGDCPIRPIIKIEGTAGIITMTLGEKSLSFAAGGKSCEADFDKQTVKKSDGTDLKVSGEFFELNEGSNTLRITNTSAYEITVTVLFTPEYMYFTDFSEYKWSDENA